MSFPNRTKVQLKSHYTNKLNDNQETYYKWTESDKATLIFCNLKYGKDYKLI